jgi:hypothetical protein
MSWLRNNDPNLDDVDDPTAQALGNLAGCTHARRLSPEGKGPYVMEELSGPQQGRMNPVMLTTTSSSSTNIWRPDAHVPGCCCRKEEEER